MNRRELGLAIPAAVLMASTSATAQSGSAAGSLVGGTSSRRMRQAAGQLLAPLDDAGRKAISFPIESERRAWWSNLPAAITTRPGLRLGDLGELSKRRLHDLLRASTSSQGYHKISSVLRHDDILKEDELAYLRDNPPKPRAGRAAIESMGSGNYWVAMFGDPLSAKNWAWLLTGHHLGATFTCMGNEVVVAPVFLGGQPAEVLTGPMAGTSVLGHEAIRGFDLVGSLHPAQAKVAVLSSEPLFSDVLSGIGRRNSLAKFEGLSAAELEAPQRRLLRALVEEYVRNGDIDAAERHLEAIEEAGWNNLHFSWRGRTDDFRSPFYYRVHGPRLIIEYALQEANHIHTIMRDPTNDYGMDWLQLHYEEHAGRR